MHKILSLCQEQIFTKKIGYDWRDDDGCNATDEEDTSWAVTSIWVEYDWVDDDDDEEEDADDAVDDDDDGDDKQWQACGLDMTGYKAKQGVGLAAACFVFNCKKKYFCTISCGVLLLRGRKIIFAADIF